MNAPSKRPINLNFLGIHFPVTAWVSIAHRLSGVYLFLFIPVLLWGLEESLKSAHAFKILKAFLMRPLWMVLIVLFLGALIYHLLAGIRHLLMDFKIGVGKTSSRMSAYGLIVLTLVVFSGLCWRFLG